MPVKVCLHCDQLHPLGQACPHATGRSWNGTRNGASHARFARAVKKRAGHQCQAITRGVRCTMTTSLHAHHTQPGNDDPATGVCLCQTHHRLFDTHAR